MSTQLWRVIIPWLKIVPQHFSWILCWSRSLRLSRNSQSTSLALFVLYLMLTSFDRLESDAKSTASLQWHVSRSQSLTPGWLFSLSSSYNNEGMDRGSLDGELGGLSLSAVCVSPGLSSTSMPSSVIISGWAISTQGLRRLNLSPAHVLASEDSISYSSEPKI